MHPGQHAPRSRRGAPKGASEAWSERGTSVRWGEAQVVPGAHGRRRGRVLSALTSPLKPSGSGGVAETAN